MRNCLLILLIILAGCNIPKNHEIKIADGSKNEEAIRIKYSTWFSSSEVDGGIYLFVLNPWKRNDTLASYFLADSITQDQVSGADFVVKVPADNIISLSSTFLGMFSILKEQDRIIAASDAKLIYDSVLFSKYLNGDLADLGQSVHLNYESVIGLNPGLVMKYIYGTPDANDARLINSGITVAYNLEYMEPHPLGRAEWVKFVAAFLGREHEADSIFEYIEQQYHIWSAKAKSQAEKPSVLDGASYKGTWYAAGGKSYPAQLYRDAGAIYHWSNDSSVGSLALSLEVIIQHQSGADFWLNTSSGSREELLGIESRYTLLKAFRKGNVYHFNKRANRNGGFDYFEMGVVRPDLLLKDLISIFHPDLTGAGYETLYLQKIR